MSDQQLIARRRAAMGPVYRLFYEEPVHLVRGEGVWLWDQAGNRYLDCYNNVASVGHCHPKVVQAICHQAGMLNTHTRYLHENVVLLAERLAALMPAPLDTCMFSCTGTEANDLAVQIARAVTGHHGVIVSEASYHGNSTLVRALSTDSYPADQRPPWLAVVEPPDLYQGPFREDDDGAVGKYVAEVERAAARLRADGFGVAALMLDTIWDAPGPLAPPVEYVADISQIVRRAGGLVIGDEVQAGHCRTGRWWGFEHYDLVPDIVTLGKPAGNGHPLAVTVTSKEIAGAFAGRGSYFNTFGGNPVSAAAGMAVLDVMAEEHLARNAEVTGGHFRAGLEGLAEKHPVIGAVKGRGLFLGLDLVADPESREPLSRERMAQLGSRLLRQGLLTGITGRHGNVLKLRPPLPFGIEHADTALSALDTVLGDPGPQSSVRQTKQRE